MTAAATRICRGYKSRRASADNRRARLRYLRYQTDECYGPDAEQPCAGFEGDDPGEETPAAPAPPADKLPAPAPAAAKGPTPEEQAAAEAKKKAADEKKRADDEKKQAEAAEKQRADAARHQRDLEKKKAAEKRREEQRAQEREEAKRREERKKREEAKRRELTRRTNLWDPSRRKAGSAKRSEAEDLVRALPWTDLAAHFGVQEARGTVVELRETPGTALPGPLRPAKQAALPERDALYPARWPSGIVGPVFCLKTTTRAVRRAANAVGPGYVLFEKTTRVDAAETIEPRRRYGLRDTRHVQHCQRCQNDPKPPVLFFEFSGSRRCPRTTAAA